MGTSKSSSTLSTEAPSAPASSSRAGRAADGSAESSWSQLSWSCTPGGWWFEEHRSSQDKAESSRHAPQNEKVSVMCGSIPGASFVTFVEGAREVYRSEESDFSAIVVKVVGSHLARCF